MQCPHCEAVMPDDDLFCEECGQPLNNPRAPLCLCGAPDGDLDDDGYCLACGRRCRPAPGEHEEFELSPDFAAVSDRGRSHHRNEDRCLINDGDLKILIVCDGVSSSADAQTASQAATTAVSEGLLAGKDLAEALKDASKAVAELGNPGGESAPSTTVVAATVRDREIHVAWLGDSRAYWISPGSAQQLTTDHSWLNDVVAAGEVTYEEGLKSPRAHAITRWMGADADAEMEPGFADFEAPGAGNLLLCSDGLWNYTASVDEMKELVLGPEPESALETARRLIAFANDKGGHDNISAAVLRFAD